LQNIYYVVTANCNQYACYSVVSNGRYQTTLLSLAARAMSTRTEDSKAALLFLLLLFLSRYPY